MICIIYKNADETITIGNVCLNDGSLLPGLTEDTLAKHARDMLKRHPHRVGFKICRSEDLPGGSADGKFDKTNMESWTISDSELDEVRP